MPPLRRSSEYPPMISGASGESVPTTCPAPTVFGGIGDHCHKFGVADNQTRPSIPVQIGGEQGVEVN